MQLDYIANILQLPDVLVQDVHVESPRAILVVLEPTPHVQACPQCHSSHHVIRKGRNANRRVRHTSVMDTVFFLCLPAIRMYCQACCAGFVWQYAFVEPKKRYSSYLRRLVSKGAVGSTCLHLVSRMAETEPTYGTSGDSTCITNPADMGRTYYKLS